MSARRLGPLSRIERQIAAEERGGIMHRWRYGREVLRLKAGRRQLPDGMIADLIKAAGVRRVGRNGETKNVLSEREIQYRIKLATVYESDQQVRKLIADLGSWSEIIRAGFPEIDIDPEPDLLDELAASEETFEQLTLIPGLGPSISTGGGRRVALADATVADVRAHRDMYSQIHENYAKKLALIEAALAAMEDGSAGDDSVNAVEAWQRGST